MRCSVRAATLRKRSRSVAKGLSFRAYAMLGTSRYAIALDFTLRKVKCLRERANDMVRIAKPSLAITSRVYPTYEV
ncbi:MAG: hypothetical protein F6K55_19005 [Moorea sp. SIO4A3]|nr:hypothetical protein [Moorena sp. SIO4A3]